MPSRCVLVVLTILLALGMQAPAHAARGMEVAVQDDPVLMGRLYGSTPKTLKLVSQLGASRIRVNVSWSYVVGAAARRRSAPKRVSYNWSGYDALIRETARRGMLLQLTLTGP